MDFKTLSKKKKAEVLEIIKSHLKQADADGLRRAMLSAGWLEGAGELVDPLMQLVCNGTGEVALAALEGLSSVRAAGSEQPIASYIMSQFKDPVPGREEVRAECIRVLGKVGTGRSVDFLAEVVVNPAATGQDREAAVEALVSLGIENHGLREIETKLDTLRGKTEGHIREAVDCALLELNRNQWEEKGFITIEAELEKEE
ncbi:MAG: HEAT repeat domain-containing protein [Gemmatimonadota bacterium]|nr:HEAT repeat domain-containing protein [Gemmatimonadota bacterium]